MMNGSLLEPFKYNQILHNQIGIFVMVYGVNFVDPIHCIVFVDPHLQMGSPNYYNRNLNSHRTNRHQLFFLARRSQLSLGIAFLEDRDMGSTLLNPYPCVVIIDPHLQMGSPNYITET